MCILAHKSTSIYICIHVYIHVCVVWERVLVYCALVSGVASATYS